MNKHTPFIFFVVGRVPGRLGWSDPTRLGRPNIGGRGDAERDLGKSRSHGGLAGVPTISLISSDSLHFKNSNSEDEVGFPLFEKI